MLFHFYKSFYTAAILSIISMQVAFLPQAMAQSAPTVYNNGAPYPYSADMISYLLNEGDNVVSLSQVPTSNNGGTGMVRVAVVIEAANGKIRVAEQLMPTDAWQAHVASEEYGNVFDSLAASGIESPYSYDRMGNRQVLESIPADIRELLNSTDDNLRTEGLKRYIKLKAKKQVLSEEDRALNQIRADKNLLKRMVKDLESAAKSLIVNGYFDTNNGIGIQYNLNEKELLQNFKFTSGILNYDKIRKMALDFDIIHKIRFDNLTQSGRIAQGKSIFHAALSEDGKSPFLTGASEQYQEFNTELQTEAYLEFRALMIKGLGYKNSSKVRKDQLIAEYYEMVRQILEKIDKGQSLDGDEVNFLTSIHKLSMYYAIGMNQNKPAFNAGELEFRIPELKVEFRNQLAGYVSGLVEFGGKSCSSIFNL